MKRVCAFLSLVAFISALLFACSDKNEPEENLPPECDDCEPIDPSSSSLGSISNSSSSSYQDCEEDCIEISSSSVDGNSEVEPPSEPGEPGDSSSSAVEDLSSSSFELSSSSIDTGANCSYRPIWCGGIAYVDVIRESQVREIGDGPKCVFATVIQTMGNQSQGPILVNGTRIGDAGGRCGNTDWGQQSCEAALVAANVQKADGGYYVSVEEWAGDFNTTGGSPVCGSTGGGNSSSSSVPRPSSSSEVASGIGNCIAPGHFVPPDGMETCIVVNGKCYKCNPDRGAECLQEWVWQGQQVTSDYWYKEISCTGGGVSSSSVAKSSSSVARSSSSVARSSSSIIASSSSARSSSSVAVSSSSLSCVGLPTTGIAGTAITPPTIRCGTTAVTSNISWSGAPNWTNPASGTFNNVRATATCGGSSQTATCSGTLTVSPAPTLTCGTLPQTTGTAGAAITSPTIKCGDNSVAFNSITWTGAPNWNSPAAGTYNNIRAAATCNNSSQTANCTGSITISAAQQPSSSSVRSSSSVGGGGTTYPPLQQGGQGVQSGYTTRYWDACKANCSWTGKAQALGSNTRCKNCSSNGTTEIAASDANRSSCDGGNAYTCFDQIPSTVNSNLAYAFAATPGGGSDCGKCFQLQFTGTGKYANDANHRAIEGKTLIVISSNTGYDVSGGQFDLLIPGGGVGNFDAFTSQLKGLGISNPSIGNREGGLLTDCERENNYNASAYKTCLTTKCNSAFSGTSTAIQTLRNGCLWLADWMQAANNPNVLYKQVDCPQYLVDKYKATMF